MKITGSTSLTVINLFFAILFVCCISLGATEKELIGGVEEIILVPSMVTLPARIDTGAATTSLDARDVFVTENVAYFKLPEKYGGVFLSLPVKEWKTIRTSASWQKRPVVEMEMCIGRRLIRCDVNLNDRSRMKYPLIIGRNVLKLGYLVDSSKSNLLGPDCPLPPSE